MKRNSVKEKKVDNQASTVVSFTKMSGAGNDFILIDNRKKVFTFSPEQIAKMCDRHFGIGADGVLLVEPAPKGIDYTMVYYNADGSLADMCGNGARCFARFALSLKKKKDSISFQTGAGLIRAKFHGDDVEINMTTPHSLRTFIKVPTKSGEWVTHALNTGVPHAVCFVRDVESIDIRGLGSEMRHHEIFQPKGTNANFVQVVGPDTIVVRTYERGVEGETLACGTGVVASSILAHLVEGVQSPVKARVRGGDELKVNFQKEDEQLTEVTLQGPARIVFTGEFTLN